MKYVAKIENKLKTLEVDAFVLACTELFLAFGRGIDNKPVVDTTRVLAEGAANHITQLQRARMRSSISPRSRL